MSAERTKQDDREETAKGPKEFAALCESMMSAEPGPGCCGSQMREMMSRFMANPPDQHSAPKSGAQAEEGEGS
jgi:hypothetical protein